MTHPDPRRLAAILLALPTLPLGLTAQSATTAPQPAAPAAETAPVLTEDDIVNLSEFRVEGNDSDSYQASSVLSGTRFNTSIRDLPKAIDVLTEAFINDIGATDMYDALRFAGGVESNSAPGIDDITGNNFVLRGISAQTTTYRNGYRAFGRSDPIMIQRIEIIRGPSSVFSGPIEPGGTINVITKRPSRNPSGYFRGRVGSFDRYRAEAMVNTPFGPDNRGAIRIGAAFEDYGSPYEFAGHEKKVVAAAIDYRLSEKGTLSADFQVLDMFVRPSAPIPYLNSSVVNTTIDRFEPNVSRTFNRQGPDALSDNFQVQTNIDYMHVINDRLSVHAGVYHRVQDLTRLLVGGSTRITTSRTTGVRTAARSITYEPGAYSWAVGPQAYLLGSFDWFGIEHRAIVGVEYSEGGSRNDGYSATLPAIDIDNPTPASYSLGNPASYAVSELRRAEDSQLGLSLNNTFKFWNGRAQLLHGIRHGRMEGTRRVLNDPNPATNTTVADTTAEAQSVGASFRITRPVSVFASYSESFVPQSITTNTSFDKDGNMLPPITGEGWDIGVKADFGDGAVSATLVMFDILRDNAPTPDPDFPGFFVADAESVARGYEAILNGKFTRSIEIVSSYAYIDTSITKDTRGNRIGWRTTNVPDHQVTGWIHYTIKEGPLRNLKFGFGVIMKTNRRGNNTLEDLPGIQLAGYTRYDARIGYETRLFGRKANFSILSQNLTDKDYMVSANGYGEERSVTASFGINF